MKQEDRVAFTKFLEQIISSREVSLAIAPDAESLAELVEFVSARGLTRCENAFDIVRTIQAQRYVVFITLTTDLPKLLYDFVVQYPTGMVQLSDPETLAQVVAHPSWENNAVLVLATKKAMEAAQTKGFLLLESVGMCWQPFPRTDLI